MFTLNDIKANAEPVGNWSKWVIHPFTDRVLLLIANRTTLTPNNLTTISFLIAMTAALFFYLGNHRFLIVGGLLYEISFALDAMDGTLARLKNMKSRFGAFIDQYCDIWKGLILSASLVYGQYRMTQDIDLYILEIWFLFVFMGQTLFYEFKQKAFSGKREEIIKGVLTAIDKIGIKNALRGKIAYPFTAIEFQVIAFFVFPLLNKVKTGFIVSSLLGTVNMLLIDFIFIISLIAYEKKK
jgi:phosphatidylglycerophosphate synthase